MNEDIIKGKWREIKGVLKEQWCKLTGDNFGEMEGKGEKLMGRLQKKYGYIKVKAELDYSDTVELAEIVSSIRVIMTKKKDVTAITFIARYGHPLLAKKQENHIADYLKIEGKEEKYGYDTDRNIGSRSRRRTAHLASQ